MPLAQVWEQRAPASPRLPAQAAALLGAQGAAQGRESKSCQVSLAVRHLLIRPIWLEGTGSGRISADLMAECLCQGFTISINKHAGVAFGTVSSNFPGGD